MKMVFNAVASGKWLTAYQEDDRFTVSMQRGKNITYYAEKSMLGAARMVVAELLKEDSFTVTDEDWPQEVSEKKSQDMPPVIDCVVVRRTNSGVLIAPLDLEQLQPIGKPLDKVFPNDFDLLPMDIVTICGGHILNKVATL